MAAVASAAVASQDRHCFHRRSHRHVALRQDQLQEKEGREQQTVRLSRQKIAVVSIIDSVVNIAGNDCTNIKTKT